MRLGDRVLGLEQFELGHANGASHDHSRIIRYSYHRPDYVRLARRATPRGPRSRRRPATGSVTVTGGLDLWPPGAAYPIDDYTGSLTAEGVAFEVIDADEVQALAAVAARRGDDGLTRPTAASPTQAATPPTVPSRHDGARRSSSGRR